MQQAFVDREKLASLGWFPDGPPMMRTDHVLQGFRQKGGGKVMYGKLPIQEVGDKKSQTQES